MLKFLWYGLSLNIAACIYLPTLAAVEPGTGLIPPTAAELAVREAEAALLIRVQPNALRLARLQAEAQEAGLPQPSVVAVDESEAVVLGKSGAESPTADDVLPKAVDNSTLAAFPPIGHQGKLNTCVPWSTTYYQLTYEWALANGIDAKNGGPSTRLSPAWTYNFLNNGADEGLGLTGYQELLQHAGAVTLAEMPYNQNDFRSWLHDAAAWRRASSRRVSAYQSVNPRTSAGQELMKGLLANGRVLTFDTYVYSWVKRSLANNPHTSDDDDLVGQAVSPWQSGSSGSHMMTIVGYNDSVWCDVNGNGIIDPGELGAFKVANSWGTSDWNAGFRWVLYDAFLTTSQLAGAPATRQPISGMPRFITGLAPSSGLYAEVTLTHSNRRDLVVAIGSGAPDSAPGVVMNGGNPNWLRVVNGQGGSFAFDGNAVTQQTWTFTFDFGVLASLPEPGTSARLFFGIKDGFWSVDGASISAFSVVNAEGAVLASASGLPVHHNASVDDSWVPSWAWVDLVIPGGGSNQAPIAYNVAASGLEDHPILVTLDGSDADGDIVAAVIVSGPVHGALSGEWPNLTYTPNPDFNGLDEFTYQVIDNEGASSNAALTSLTVTAVNDAPTFTPGADLIIFAGSGPLLIAAWASDISAGPTVDEYGSSHGVPFQSLTFTCTIEPSGLFLVPPTITADGTLSFTPGTTAGLATVTVTLTDSGGTANGGEDSSSSTFTIRLRIPRTVTMQPLPGQAWELNGQDAILNQDGAETFAPVPADEDHTLLSVPLGAG